MQESNSNSNSMEKFRVTINTTSGLTFELDGLKSTDRIEDIKNKIATDYNIFADQQHLIYRGKELNNGMLQDFGISNGSTITLAPSMHSGPLYAAKRATFFDRKEITSLFHTLPQDQVAFLLEQKKPITVTTKVGDHLVVFTIMPSDIEEGLQSTRASTQQDLELNHQHNSSSSSPSSSRKSFQPQRTSTLDNIVNSNSTPLEATFNSSNSTSNSNVNNITSTNSATTPTRLSSSSSQRSHHHHYFQCNQNKTSRAHENPFRRHRSHEHKREKSRNRDRLRHRERKERKGRDLARELSDQALKNKVEFLKSLMKSKKSQNSDVEFSETDSAISTPKISSMMEHDYIIVQQENESEIETSYPSSPISTSLPSPISFPSLPCLETVYNLVSSSPTTTSTSSSSLTSIPSLSSSSSYTKSEKVLEKRRKSATFNLGGLRSFLMPTNLSKEHSSCINIEHLNHSSSELDQLSLSLPSSPSSSSLSSSSSSSLFSSSDSLDTIQTSSSTTNFETLTHTSPNSKKCAKCSKKLRLAGTFSCKCGHTFCSAHRFGTSTLESNGHVCDFDYKTFGRQQLSEANPLIQAPKVPHL